MSSIAACCFCLKIKGLGRKSASVRLIGLAAILHSLIFLFDVAAVYAERSPKQVAIVANANSGESLSVAQYYAARRGMFRIAHDRPVFIG